MIWLFPFLAVFGLLPAVWGWRLAWYYWRNSHPARPAEGALPKAAIILCVRGLDPSLPACLRGLLRQDYPSYELHVIIDSENDPAWPAVHDMVRERPANVRIRVEALRDPLTTCSLKVSSQLQALAGLSDGVEIVAFVDADSEVQPDWLHEMSAPLADPKVGATSGIRWFAPTRNSWGDLVRHIYNAGSFTQMFVFRMPWGGALALRRETLAKADLPTTWSRSFCEDAATYGQLHPLGLKLVFVPAATQLNREAISSAGARRFMLRQLLCVRLHHYYWRQMWFLNILNAIALVAIAALLGVHLWLGDALWSCALGGLLGGFILLMVGGLVAGDRLVRTNMRSRIADIPPPPMSWKILPAAIATQSLSMRLMIETLSLPRIDWRGIVYHLLPNSEIRLDKYEPFKMLLTDPNRSVV